MRNIFAFGCCYVRKAGRPDAERYQSEQVLMDELLRTMAILEAEAILEE